MSLINRWYVATLNEDGTPAHELRGVLGWTCDDVTNANPAFAVTVELNERNHGLFIDSNGDLLVTRIGIFVHFSAESSKKDRRVGGGFVLDAAPDFAGGTLAISGDGFFLELAREFVTSGEISALITVASDNDRGFVFQDHDGSGDSTAYTAEYREAHR